MPRQKLETQKVAARSIRVDAEVYGHIEKNTKKLNDTPNAVLRRLFGLDKGEVTPSNGKRNGKK